MKAIALVVMIAIPVLLNGCQKSDVSSNPAKPTATVSVREPWQIKRDHLKEVVKIGMSEEEVTMAVGDPERTMSQGGAVTLVTWQYDLGAGNWFDVRFDNSNRVAVAELDGIKVM